MSENIPESIPTSADPRSRRPIKKSRPNPTANPLANDVENLFADPEREINLPLTAAEAAARSATLAASQVPEIVANVQGSSAGAGSGEFHVYKASRRREYDRVRKMEEEVEKEKADESWARKQEQRRKEDEEKRAKNKAKRDKKNKKKANGKNVTEGKGNPAKKEGNSNDDNGGVAMKPAPGVTNGKDSDQHVSMNQDIKHVHNPEEIGVIIHEDD